MNIYQLIIHVMSMLHCLGIGSDMHVRASIIDLVEISQLNNLLILCCWNRLKLSKLVLLNDRM